jgi:hypothetical protein
MDKETLNDIAADAMELHGHLRSRGLDPALTAQLTVAAMPAIVAYEASTPRHGIPPYKPGSSGSTRQVRRLAQVRDLLASHQERLSGLVGLDNLGLIDHDAISQLARDPAPGTGIQLVTAIGNRRNSAGAEAWVIRWVRKNVPESEIIISVEFAGTASDGTPMYMVAYTTGDGR